MYSLDWLVDKWDFEAEKAIEISELEFNQVRVVIKTDQMVFGQKALAEMKDLEVELRFTTRFIIGGKNVVDGFDTGRLANYRFFKAFLSYFMSTGLSPQVTTILTNQIVDFRIPIYDNQSNVEDTLLTFLLIHYRHPNAVEYIGELIKFLPADLLDKSNSAGRTPLSIAIQRNDAELVKKLVDAGANINIAAPGCLTPFLTVIAQNNINLLTYFLITGKFDLNICAPINGKCQNFINLSLNNSSIIQAVGLICTPSLIPLDPKNLALFIFNLYCNLPSSSDVIPELLNALKALSLSLIDHTFNQLALLALENDSASLLTFLHSSGHYLHSRTYNLGDASSQLIHIAAYLDKYEIAKTLLNLGADVNALTSKNESVLTVSMRNNSSRQITVELIRRGAYNGLNRFIILAVHQNYDVSRISRISPHDFTQIVIGKGQNMFTYAVTKDFPEFIRIAYANMGEKVFKNDSLGFNVLTTPLPQNPSSQLRELLEKLRLDFHSLNQPKTLINDA